MRVAVVGGGISGLTLARALTSEQAANKFNVQIFERDFAEDLEDRRGSVITLHPNGTLALREVGCNPDDLQVAISDFRLFEKNGALLGAFPPSTGGRMVTRRGLKQMLTRDLNAQVNYNSRVVDITEESDDEDDENGGVTLDFENGTSATFDLVVGADGSSSSSSLRSRVVPVGKAAKSYRGVARLNGSLPLADVPSNLQSISEGTSMTLGDGSVFFVSRNPAEHQLLWSLAFPHADDSKFPEFSSQQERQDFVLQRLESGDWWPDCAELVRESSTIGSVSGYYDQDPVKSYSRGRMILMGDAAHAMTPYQGQGANLALEDGVCLGRLLTAHGDDLDFVRRGYDQLRVNRTKKMQDASRRGMQMFHWSGFFATRMRSMMMRFAMQADSEKRNRYVYGDQWLKDTVRLINDWDSFADKRRSLKAKLDNFSQKFDKKD